MLRLPVLPAILSSESIVYWSIGLLIVAWVLKGIFAAHVQRKRMPPGPKGIPRSRFSRGLSAMNLAFSGPIFSLNLAGQPVVVLNNHKVVADLLGWSEVVWPFPADC